MSLAEAADRVFRARFDAVELTWPEALDLRGDPEPVHQLRVATRRAAAAVRSFGDLLTKRVGRRLRRVLRQLRRAAGAARDWDVMGITVGERAEHRPDAELPGLDLLRGLALAGRRDAQPDLYATANCRGQWDELRAAVNVRKRGDETLGDRAAATLPELLDEFAAAAGDDLADPDRLHSLRIVGKRLRYSLELFADCYSTPVRERLVPAIETVQDVLGDANDGRVIAGRLDAVLADLEKFTTDGDRFRVGVVAWRKELAAKLGAGPDRFRAWYGEWLGLAQSVDFTTPATPAAGRQPTAAG